MAGRVRVQVQVQGGGRSQIDIDGATAGIRQVPCQVRSRCYYILNLALSLRVSSVLNRDSRQFGKKFMFDNHDDTCWNSDQVW